MGGAGAGCEVEFSDMPKWLRLLQVHTAYSGPQTAGVLHPKYRFKKLTHKDREIAREILRRFIPERAEIPKDGIETVLGQAP
jgi:hypothetical protein